MTLDKVKLKTLNNQSIIGDGNITVANSTHSHTYSDISNVSVVTVTVTYSDSTTGTIKLLQYTGS